ncbi:MAG TPA: fumarylacetoacetate hydrolase family protein [Hyphomicrobiaceae bacterium]|jgi:2-keto-4-pentenoate hydratase/2-oxohepta-3-ene-1,7-dioic acid hydratase in catechol pathway
MRLGSFQRNTGEQGPRVGLFLDDGVVDVGRANPDIPSDVRGILAGGERQLAALEAILSQHQKGALPQDAFVPFDQLRFRPPVRPGKIICVGGNYEDYRRILKLPDLPVPAFFLKSPDAVIAHDEEVQIPEGYGIFYQEWELSCVIGRQCRRVSEQEARDCIAGYTIVNDITGHTLETLGPRPYHMLGKNMDTFAPIGPWIVARDSLAKDVYQLRARRWRNNELVCESSTREMRRSFEEIIVYVSNFMTLYPGDIVTGASPPAGPIEPGDVIEVEFEAVGRLRNTVGRADADPIYGERIGIASGK